MSMVTAGQFQEVVRLVSQQIKKVHFAYFAKIVTPKGTFDCFKVIKKDIMRDFEAAYTDAGTIEVLMALDIFMENVYPYRDNLEVQIIKLQRSEHPMMDISGAERTVSHFKGIITNVKDEATSNPEKTPDGHVRDRERQFKYLTLQLVDVASDLLSKQTIGGIFTNQIPGEVLKGLMGESAKKTSLETSLSIKGVDMVPPNMQDPKLQYVIPDNTPVIELPNLIQSSWFGIYNNGIGAFLFNRNWYIYPLHDSSRYLQEDRRLTVYVVAKELMPSSPRTYTIQNREIIMVTSSDVVQMDNQNVSNLNQGNAITIQNPEQVAAREGYQAKDGKITASPNTVQSTFALSKREDGTNMAPNSQVVESVNIAFNMSKLSAREGHQMAFVWESANDELIIPGMPVKVIYSREGKFVEVVGTVLKHQSFTSIQGDVMTSIRYDTKVALGLFVTEPPSNLAGRR